MKLSLIIFFYDEEGSLKRVYNDTLDFLQTSTLITDFEIILIDDGSKDNSNSVAQELLRNAGTDTRLITHKQNLGIGETLKRGYKEAQLEYVCALPGDGQFLTKHLQKLRKFGNDEFISFFRESNEVYSFYRKTLTTLNRVFNSVFLSLNLKDVNWIKVYKKSQLDSIDIQLSSSIVESEICAKLSKLGCRPIELSSTYENRLYGKSTAGKLRSLAHVISETVLLYYVIMKFKR